MVISRTSGRLSKEHCDYMRKSYITLNINEMAAAVGKEPKTVRRFLKENNLPAIDSNDDERESSAFRETLTSTAFYSTLKEQLLPDEVIYFEKQWVAWLGQFKGNIQHSEKEALKDRIMDGISVNRLRERSKKAQEDLNDLENKINKEERKSDKKDMSKIMSWKEEISFLRSSLDAAAKTEIEYKKQIEKTDKALKARREDRIKTIKDSQETFTGLLLELEDEERREKHGMDMEIHRIAKEKSTEDLAQEHQFIDDKFDIPLFTPEVAEKIKPEDMPHPY